MRALFRHRNNPTPAVLLFALLSVGGPVSALSGEWDWRAPGGGRTGAGAGASITVSPASVHRLTVDQSMRGDVQARIAMTADYPAGERNSADLEHNSGRPVVFGRARSTANHLSVHTNAALTDLDISQTHTGRTRGDDARTRGSVSAAFSISGPRQDEPRSDGVGEVDLNVTAISNFLEINLSDQEGDDARAMRVRQESRAELRADAMIAPGFVSPDAGTGTPNLFGPTAQSDRQSTDGTPRSSNASAIAIRNYTSLRYDNTARTASGR